MKRKYVGVWRSGMALVLALCLMAGFLPASVFAAEAPIKYVSLGDSMTNGLGLGGGYDSTGHNGYLEVDKYSYPALLAEHYGWELTQLATSAMRAEDLHYILEVGTENAYPGDEWTQDDLLDGRWNGIGQEGSKWYGMTADQVFQKAVAEADVISMAVGNGNFGVYMMDMITSAVGVPDTYGKDYSHCTLDNALAVLELDAQTVVMVKNIFDEVLSYLGAYVPQDLANTLADRFAYVVANFAVHFEGALDRIVELNPDVEIIIASLMNTMSGYDMYITYEGSERYLNMAAVLDLILVPVNAYMAGLAAAKQEQVQYAQTKFYFAETGSLETLAATFSQGYAENEAFYLSRFVPNITDFVFPMLGIPGDVIAAEDVLNYRRVAVPEGHTRDQAYVAMLMSSGISEEAAVSKVYAINIYNVVEDAVLNALEQTPVINIDELTAVQLPDGEEFSVEVFLKALLGAELFNADGSMNPAALYENGAIVALLSIYGRIKLADGISAHPSKKDHVNMASNMISAYNRNYTAKAETQKNIESALNFLVEVLKVYGPDVWLQIKTDYETTGVDVVIEDDFKYVALGDGSAAADGYAEALNAYLAAEAAENGIDVITFVNEAEIGNSVAAEAADLSAEVADADLITLGFSQTDMLANAITAGELDWAALLGAEAVPYVEEALAKVAAEIDALELPEEMKELLKATVEAYAYNVVEYTINLPQLIYAIREVNEDAVVIVVGMYNPIDDITAFGYDLSAVGEYFDYLIEAADAYGIGLAMLTGELDYVVADEVEIAQSKLSLGDLGDLLEGDLSVMYPSANGDAYIAERIENALTLSFEVGGLWGDADGDGIVTPIDAMLVLQYYVGDITAAELNVNVCDVDDDGAVSPIDAMLILQYYVGDIAKFPVEG